MDSEEQAQKKKEDASLTMEERLVRSLEQESQHKPIVQESDPESGVSDFMRGL
jgi:hypothetical protein